MLFFNEVADKIKSVILIYNIIDSNVSLGIYYLGDLPVSR